MNTADTTGQTGPSEPKPPALPGNGVCLVMIVRDEAAVIARGLRTTLPFVDTFSIVDTGSKDNTVDIIAQVATELGRQGFVHFRPWVDFGHNRTESLKLARTSCGATAKWFLIMDADDLLVTPPSATQLPIPDGAHTTHASFRMRAGKGGLEFWRHHLLNADGTRWPWEFRGVLHEHPYLNSTALQAGVQVLVGVLDRGFWVDARCEGCRSRNPSKYADDAALLERELAKDPTNTRNAYYLAQSWRDAGERDKAREAYIARAQMADSYVDERYIAYSEAIRLSTDVASATALAWKALELRPDRGEATTHALALARTTPGEKPAWTRELFGLALVNDRTLATLESLDAPSCLHVNPEVYKSLFATELACIAAYFGQLEFAMKCFMRGAGGGDSGQLTHHMHYLADVIVAQKRGAPLPAQKPYAAVPAPLAPVAPGPAAAALTEEGPRA